MAGNEGQGVAAAAPDLFEGTVYLLTSTPRTARGSVQRLAGLAQALGAVPLEVEPAEHDRTVALVSHLPYLVAAALMGAAGDAGSAAGPSLLGATRVAGSPVAMWAQICRLNREQILDALRVFRKELDRLEAAISAVLSAGLRTADIQGPGSAVVSTAQMGDAIIAELAKG